MEKKGREKQMVSDALKTPNGSGGTSGSVFAMTQEARMAALRVLF